MGRLSADTYRIIGLFIFQVKDRTAQRGAPGPQPRICIAARRPSCRSRPAVDHARGGREISEEAHDLSLRCDRVHTAPNHAMERGASVARIERSEIRDGTWTRLRRPRVSLALNPGYDPGVNRDLCSCTTPAGRYIGGESVTLREQAA